MTTTSTPIHDPRPYLFEKETFIVHIGEIDTEGFAGGEFADPYLKKQLSREQWSDYRHALREGYHPVLVMDIQTGVAALEMRKQQ